MKKLVMAMVGLVVLGMTSVFAVDGKKITDMKALYPSYSVTYSFNVNNKSTNDVSFLLIKYLGNEKSEAYEYVIPAKTKDVIEFTTEIDNVKGDWWGFGWVNENGSVGNGGAEWWSQQNEIVVDKDGWLTYKENGSTKKMSKIKKLQ